jgi:hypothetical protein|tara:strand:- start:266 stop:1741 length:1476 start_codon:yes stop_codon:yes gene_type:complete
MKIQLQPCFFIFLLLLVSCSSPDNETIPTSIQLSTKEYTLTVNYGEGGTVSTSGGTYEEGTSVTLTATPDPQFIFTGWSNGTTETSITITVNSNITIEATFSFDCSTIQSETIDWNNLSYNLFDIDAPKNQDGSYIEEYRFLVEEGGAFVDYNNDGYKDIIFLSTDFEDMRERESGYTGYERKQPIRFYLGSCDGYSVDTNNDSKFLGLVHVRKTLLGDYNNDGDVDVFFIGHGYDRPPFPGEFNKVLLSNGEGTFIENDFIDSVSFFHGGASGDFDNDGDLDVFVTDAGKKGFTGFFINDGSGNFLLNSSIVNQDHFSELYNAELYDINKDGFLDIISGGHDWNWSTNVYDNTTSIIYGNGISYVDSEIIRLPESTIYGQGIMTDVDFFDINNNGQDEIIITKTGDSKDNNPENFYKGWSIQILQLVGNEYQDNTEQFIDVSYNPEESWIIRLSISDKDSDGIIEMFNGIPGSFGYHEWKLINGVFVKTE